MPHNKMQRTGLWKEAFADRSGDPFADQRKRLSASLLTFRKNIEPIVKRIAEVLPGLTLHDITHLDALWETADLIAGDKYPLNPLEAFVFGSAVLLHDSAMCWEAYANGQPGVRITDEWKDAYADECDRCPAKDDAERRAVADFAALRALHAHQAAKLPEMAWTHPDTGQEQYLIEDAQLRTELGRLAGRIASSHHWDIDTLVVGLGEQFNAPSAFPSEWSVDPIKVACLLRCADASHVNDARAPLFLYALVKRQGISLNHWRAQSRLMGPSLDNGDPSGSAIVYTSSRPFSESDAVAWWIAHDAVVMIDKELRLANALLKSRVRPMAPEFRVKRVSGVDSLDTLTRNLQVEGWAPCKAEPHVSNVESLVRELGGEKLYGTGIDTVEVVLRELIQNARDGVVARRFVEPDFEGEILIRIEDLDGQRWLVVEDDGIGMSRKVLTGPLLDFGNSFWKSSLVNSEFPGLRSSRFRSIGRFGIGFYSIFMIAEQADVSSKGWDKGLDDCNTLLFNSGVSLRPILRAGRPEGFATRLSTRVRLRLKPQLLLGNCDIEIKPPFMEAKTFSVSFHSFISALSIGLDVRILTSCLGASRLEVHGGVPYQNPSAKLILSNISFAVARTDPNVDAEVGAQYQRLRPINSDNTRFGVAAITTSRDNGQSMLSMPTIGGLATSIRGRGHHGFIGYINYKPDSARRGPLVFEAPPEVMSLWGVEQLKILDDAKVSDLERSIAGLYACDFGVDPIEFGRTLVSISECDHRFLTYHELALMAENHPVGVFKSSYMDYIETYHSRQTATGVALVLPLVTCGALALKMIDDKPAEANSIIGCIHRAIVLNGRVPVWSGRKTTYQSTLTGNMDLLCVSSRAN
jgi:hypothetical protein